MKLWLNQLLKHLNFLWIMLRHPRALGAYEKVQAHWPQPTEPNAIREFLLCAPRVHPASVKLWHLEGVNVPCLAAYGACPGCEIYGRETIENPQLHYKLRVFNRLTGGYETQYIDAKSPLGRFLQSGARADWFINKDGKIDADLASYQSSRARKELS